MHPLDAPGALWVLSRAGKVPRPPAGGRNLPQETDFLRKAGNGLTFLFTVSQRLSPLRRRPGGFPIAPWTPSGASIPCRWAKPLTRNKFLAEGRKRAYLSSPVSQRISPLRRRPGGFPIAPWTPSGASIPCRWAKPLTRNGFLAAGRKRAYLSLPCITKSFASAEATRGLSDRPLDPFGAHPDMRG